MAIGACGLFLFVGARNLQYHLIVIAFDLSIVLPDIRWGPAFFERHTTRFSQAIFLERVVRFFGNGHLYNVAIPRRLPEHVAEMFVVGAADGLLVAGIAWH